MFGCAEWSHRGPGCGATGLGGPGRAPSTAQSGPAGREQRPVRAGGGRAPASRSGPAAAEALACTCPARRQVSSARVALTCAAPAAARRTRGEPGAGLRHGECVGSGRHREVRTGRYRLGWPGSPHSPRIQVLTRVSALGRGERSRRPVPPRMGLGSQNAWGHQPGATAPTRRGGGPAPVVSSQRSAVGRGEEPGETRLGPWARRHPPAGPRSLSDRPVLISWRDFSRQAPSCGHRGGEKGFLPSGSQGEGGKSQGRRRPARSARAATCSRVRGPAVGQAPGRSGRAGRALRGHQGNRWWGVEGPRGRAAALDP